MYPELQAREPRAEVAVVVAVGMVVVVCSGKGSPPPARWVCENSMQLKQGRERVCVL